MLPIKRIVFLLTACLLCRFAASGQIAVTGYNHVALAVKDLDASTLFYKEVVGLKPVPVPENLKAIRSWFYIGPGQELHLLAGRVHPVANNDRNGAHYSITIPNADPVEAYLKKLGLPYHRQQRFDGAFQIFIADPDGYVIELNEPKVAPKTASVVYPTVKMGVFDHAGDVGDVRRKGSATYDSVAQTYRLRGAGSNIWFKKDEFQYAWKFQTGNFILQTRAGLVGPGVDPHRKFGWMARASLDTNAAMVCATVHGDGLTAIQFRKQAGANVEEVKSPVKMPDILQLERRGRSFFMSVARFGEPFWTVEVPDFDFPPELHVGLFVCSHHADAVEEAWFDNVRTITPAKPNFVPYREYIGSHLETVDITTGQRRILYSENASLQAPNWTNDNKALIYNKGGLLYRRDFATGKSAEIPTGTVRQNNNDHVLSFNGKMLGLSSSSGTPEQGSLIYTVPVEGGDPKLITPDGPSYLHGWSPNGKWLTYTARRKDNEYDIYKIPAAGGKEIQLTTTPGLDDGSEFSPDGKYIWFNSVRSGRMQLWRMDADGKNQTQRTFDAFNNWFPHLSPDGKWVVFLSYQLDVKPDDHPFYRHVYLRKMPADGSAPPQVIAYFYGGQGSINTPSWSPDGKSVAFVSNSGW
jgi:TolB protein